MWKGRCTISKDIGDIISHPSRIPLKCCSDGAEARSPDDDFSAGKSASVAPYSVVLECGRTSAATRSSASNYGRAYSVLGRGSPSCVEISLGSMWLS